MQDQATKPVEQARSSGQQRQHDQATTPRVHNELTTTTASPEVLSVPLPTCRAGRRVWLVAVLMILVRWRESGAVAWWELRGCSSV